MSVAEKLLRNVKALCIEHVPCSQERDKRKCVLEQALQAALDETETYLADTGLKLSPSNSELLLYRPARQGVGGLTPLNHFPVALYASGQKIPRVDSAKILGLLIDARGCNAKTITHVTARDIEYAKVNR